MAIRMIEQSAMVEICPSRDAALQHIERAGRTCYQSEPKGNPADFVRMLIKRGHHSVLEHCSATLRFVTDRGVTHELVRHRIASFSQESTRYCNLAKSDAISIIKPVWWGQWPVPKQERWLKVMETIADEYLLEISEGTTPQEARAVLPNALKTEIVVTANFREWRHIFELRTSKAAHPQMRDLMQQAHADMLWRCPEVFGEPE